MRVVVTIILLSGYCCVNRQKMYLCADFEEQIAMCEIDLIKLCNIMQLIMIQSTENNKFVQVYRLLDS